MNFHFEERFRQVHIFLCEKFDVKQHFLTYFELMQYLYAIHKLHINYTYLFNFHFLHKSEIIRDISNFQTLNPLYYFNLINFRFLYNQLPWPYPLYDFPPNHSPFNDYPEFINSYLLSYFKRIEYLQLFKSPHSDTILVALLSEQLTIAFTHIYFLDGA
jgi:hypothetical protein